ncbi:16902_t:CDS:2 [Acaulospora colombiana]|uniref:16902_t:CDS:1 n=1 Tax=Acaulospora colombiana TaxID=27376 RepID=A0ACA9PN74_9GLOM|nr:16902_t:CDS:2 [Acaulospora colombiana]
MSQFLDIHQNLAVPPSLKRYWIHRNLKSCQEYQIPIPGRAEFASTANLWGDSGPYKRTSGIREHKSDSLKETEKYLSAKNVKHKGIEFNWPFILRRDILELIT